jgi:uncharacterized damage-inducible protein DinB
MKSGAIGAAVAAAAPLVSAAGTDLEVLRNRWGKAKTFTLQVADAMPAGDYNVKPYPDMRGFGELMAHIGSGNVFYFSRFADGAVPGNLNPPKTFEKEIVKKYLADTFDFCAGMLAKMTQAGLDKSYPGRGNQPAQTGWDWVLNGFIHTAHHRGYAEVYLREKNITPPTYAV